MEKKETFHWVFLGICFLFSIRIISLHLLVFPDLEKNSVPALFLYRFQSISVIFLPASFAHLFQSLMYKNNKNDFIFIIIIYIVTVVFYILAIIGFDPILNKWVKESSKYHIIINTASYIFKSIILLFISTYIFSIHLLHSFSKIILDNKKRKSIFILKIFYIITFGYGYFVQFLISLFFPKFISLTPYLICIFCIALYYIIKNYGFLNIYQINKIFDVINNDFSLSFIVTDDQGVIIKTNYIESGNIFEIGTSIYSLFPDFRNEINIAIHEGKNLTGLKCNLNTDKYPVALIYEVDVNQIKDRFNDFVGCIIIIKDFKVSFESFTKREQDIIEYLIQGVSYKEIAFELNISYNTVNSHIKNIYKKSYVSSRKEFVESINNTCRVL
ncbi:MAG: hypothetical protein A2015_10925 [Spirochaetes bacterium GWF1_31_7]|nr:MAG: hypothetical protein A2015_10925 [Spirochaetes bacterium GWF1_31_7]